MKQLLISVFFLTISQVLFGQDVRIYHGERSESVFLKYTDKLEHVGREPVKIVRSTEGMVTVTVVNPNPFFYNYEVKTEDIELVDDYSDQFSELVGLITSMPEISAQLDSRGARLAPGVDKKKFGEYETALKIVNNQIKKAKNVIKKSDKPELLKEAFDRVSNTNGFGFRAAIDEIQKILIHESGFNSKTLDLLLHQNYLSTANLKKVQPHQFFGLSPPNV